MMEATQISIFRINFIDQTKILGSTWPWGENKISLLPQRRARYNI